MALATKATTLVAIGALFLAALLALCMPAGAAGAKARRHRQPNCRSRGVPFVAISPLVGATAVPAGSQISFRGALPSQLREVSVTGAVSGRHAGTLRRYASAKGASFVPSSPFAAGESVEVHATVHANGGCRKIARRFAVAREARPVVEEAFEYQGTPGEMQHFESNNVKPPVVEISQPATAVAAPGDIFATPYLGPAEHGPMIFEGSGRLVWFHLLPTGWSAADFGPQTYEGAEDLVWWQGQVSSLGTGSGEDVIMNDRYQVVAKIHAGNGLSADLHGIELTGAGAAFLTAYQPVRIGASTAAGAARRARGRKGKRPRSRVVLDSIVQEIDVKTGLVMWEWDSVGHVPLRESSTHLPATRATPWDYFHIASAQRQPDGNLRIGGAGVGEVYEVSGTTGRVLSHEPAAGSVALDGGDEQPLSTGGRLVYHGGEAGFSEYGPEGALAYAASFPAGEVVGRVYRAPWSAQPAGKPGVATKAEGTKTDVAVSWNGVTDVAEWELLAGGAPSNLQAVAIAPDAGFETSFSIPAAPYVQVLALGAAGEVIAESKIKESVQEGEE